MILLVRPNSKKKNYQGLANNLAAIEPPLWMALRARHLIYLREEVKVLDLEVENTPEKIDSSVEIFPLGNHPSAYIQQREGIKDIVKKISGKVKIWKTIPEFSKGEAPAWKLFNLSKYRAHNWHCWGGIPRSPYVTTYTSTSCPFNCSFCNIKSFYKNGYKERDIFKIIQELNYYKKLGIRNIKFMDEMFFCNWKRVQILSMIMLTRKYGFNIWAYARIDTIKKGREKCPGILHYMFAAGFKWLALGIESGNEEIRKKALKGRFSNEDIRKVVQQIQHAGIHVGANYIFGFPDDNLKSMRQTLNFAKELNCEYSNFYTMMAYPGSQLHEEAKERKWDLPKTWSGYSQYSYDCHPIRTKYLTSADVLKFRDEAFQEYYTSDRYLKMIKERFGEDAISEIKSMTKVKLKRGLLEVGNG